MAGILLVAAIISCSSDSAGEGAIDLHQVMPGTWEAVSVHVIVNTALNQDSSYVFEVKEREWKRKLGVQPIKTYYLTKDNGYRSEYYNLEDSLVNVTRGRWFVNGDSLRLVTPEATYEYEVSVSKGLGTFRALMDWDGDGQEDDNYTGIQRRISRYVE